MRTVPPGDAEPVLPPYDGRKESTAGGTPGRGENVVSGSTGVTSSQDTSTRLAQSLVATKERRLRPTRRERGGATTSSDRRRLRQPQ
jgi:hypothetical protein